jgi:beta-glucosidase/6-phospho-beta-glucosidase/beta-galactosidase
LKLKNSSGYAEGTKPSDPESWMASWDSLDFELGWFAEPIFGSGDYPQVMRERLGNSTLPKNFLPKFTPEQIATNRGSDFFGVNHYTTHLTFPSPNTDTGYSGSGINFENKSNLHMQIIVRAILSDPELNILLVIWKSWHEKVIDCIY